MEAETVHQMISWQEDVYGPPLACTTSQSLQQVITEPMNVPKWPGHNQGVERVVKSVAEMSCKYCPHGQTDGAVRLQKVIRLAYGIGSKKDLASMTGRKEIPEGLTLKDKGRDTYLETHTKFDHIRPGHS